MQWVNVKTLVDEGAWSEPHMAAWDQTLTVAAARYANLKVYDWAAVVQPEWFQPDRIHYTSAGYAQRARLIAVAPGGHLSRRSGLTVTPLR